MVQGYNIHNIEELPQYEDNPSLVEHPEIELETQPTLLQDEFDPRLLEPGMYTAFSDTPAYPILYGLAVTGQVVFGGLRYYDGGVNQMLVLVGVPEAEANPERNAKWQAAVVVPHEAFTSIPEEEYGDTTWQQMWWREVIQNSVDAGATRIHCRIEEQEDGTWLASCQDNGHGMSAQDIVDRFFRLKASKKFGETTIGGFGEAKKFIALAWIGFRVRSLDAQVQGSGADWPNLVVEDELEHLDGTLVEVVMPADKHTTEMAARDFIAKCTLPNISFTVNGESVRADLKVGEYKRELPYGTKLYYNKSGRINAALVRANGLYMFSKDLPSDFKGTIAIELFPKRNEFPTPKDLFTATRMDFRWNELGESVRDFLQKARSDVREALRDPEALTRQPYPGTGLFSSEDPVNQARLRDKMGPLPRRQPGKDTELRMTEEQQGEFLNELRSQYESSTERSGGDVADAIGILDPATAAILASIGFKGESHVDAAVEQMVWKPDFFIMNDETMRKGFRIDKRFEPATMTSSVLALAKCWAELVRLVFVVAGVRTRWGVGFVFSKEALGMWQAMPDGKKYVCLNPFDLDSGKLLSIRDDKNLSHIFAVAIHECAHHIDGYDYHSEGWRRAVDRILKDMMRYWPQVKRIAKSIKIKGTGKEAGAHKKAAKSVTCEIQFIATDRVSHLVVRPDDSDGDVLDLEYRYFTPMMDSLNLYVYEEQKERFVDFMVEGDKQWYDLAGWRQVNRKWVLEAINAAYALRSYEEVSPRSWFLEDVMPTEVWIRPDGFLQLRPADRRSVRYVMKDWNIPMSVTAPVLAQYGDLNKLVNAVINMKLKPETDSGYENIFAELRSGAHVVLPYDPYVYIEELRNYLDNLRADLYDQFGGYSGFPMGDPVSPVNVSVTPNSNMHGQFDGYHVTVSHLPTEKWYKWAYDLFGGTEIVAWVPVGPTADAFLEHIPKSARSDLENLYNVWDLELDRHVFELLLERQLSARTRGPADLDAPLTVLRP